MLLRAALLGVGLAVLTAAVLAQAPAFEVASIKTADLREAIDIKYLPGRFVATNVTVQLLIMQAYGLELRQVEGGPNAEVRYDITATTDTRRTVDEMRAMLKTLLEERLKLAVEHQTREGTVYKLVANSPHGLRPAAHPDERGLVSLTLDQKDGRVSYTYEGHNATMTALAMKIANQLHAPVMDATSLAGSFDFAVHFRQDSTAATDRNAEPDAGEASIYTALPEQLGLKLEAGRGPVDVLVIDHIEKPTEN